MEILISALPSVACGFVIGFLIAYSGIGGGALIIPAMVVFFDLSASEAIGTASVFAVAAKTFAGIEHWRINNIPKRLSLLMVAAGIPGVLLSASLVNHFSQDGGDSFQAFLRYLIAAAIVLSLIVAQLKPSNRADAPTPYLLLAGFAVGIMMGATGVGGGVMIVPLLLLLSREEPRRVVGASIIIALMLSGVTAAVYAGGGQVNYELAVLMTAGAFLAVIPATRILRKSSDATVLRMMNGLILIALGIMLWG